MTKYFSYALFTTLALAILPGCWSKKEEATKKQNLYVINVLDSELFNDCHIAGSVNVALDKVESFAKDLDKSSEIVVYCSGYTCTASGFVAQQFKSLGFEKVWAYEAGMADWYQKGIQNPGKYPVTGSCKKSYLTSANNKVAEEGSVATISTEALREKMIAHGIIA